MMLLSGGLGLIFLFILFQNSSSRTEKEERKRLEQGNARLVFSILYGHADLMKQALDEGATVNTPVDPFLVETILKLGRAFDEFPVVPPLHFAMNYGKRAQLNMGSMLLRAHADPNRYSLPPADLAVSTSVSKDSSSAKNTDKSSPPGKAATKSSPFHHGYAPAAMYALGFGQEAGNSHAAVLQRLYREHPDRFNLTVLDEWRRLTGNPPLTHLMIYWQNFDGLYFVVSEWTKDVNERAYAPPRLAAASTTKRTLTASQPQPQQQQHFYRTLLPRSTQELTDWSIDPYGLTPLHLAAWFGDVSATVFLLHNGADLFARTHFYGHLPIHLAVFRHHSVIVSLHLAYAIERKRDPDDAWRTLIQMASNVVPDFDLVVFRTYTRWLQTKYGSTAPSTATASAREDAATVSAVGETETCPRSSASSSGAAAASRSGSSSLSTTATNTATAAAAPARDTIDYLLLQPRLYAAVPVVHNLSQLHQWSIQPAPPVSNGPAGGMHQGHSLQKQLSWDFLVDKLHRERYNEWQMHDPAADRFTIPHTTSARRKSSQRLLSDTCQLPRSIDVVSGPRFTPRIYRDEYYTLQRPVLVTDGPAQRVGIWANVPTPSTSPSATADADAGANGGAASPTSSTVREWEATQRVQEAQTWQVFREIFVARFQSYPVHVYRSVDRAALCDSDATGSRGSDSDSDSDESERRYRFLAAQFNHTDALAVTLASRFTTPTRISLSDYIALSSSSTSSSLLPTADVAEAMITLDQYQDDFFTEMPYPTSSETPPTDRDQAQDEGRDRDETGEPPLASLFVPICHASTATTRRRLFPRLAALLDSQQTAASSFSSQRPSNGTTTRTADAAFATAAADDDRGDDDDDDDGVNGDGAKATATHRAASAAAKAALPLHLRHIRSRPRSSLPAKASAAHWPHLIAPHPFYEPFRLVVTPAPVQPTIVRVTPATTTTAAASTASVDGDSAAATPLTAATTDTMTPPPPPPLRVEDVASVLLTTGAPFLQQYTQTGYAPPRAIPHHVPSLFAQYRDTLRNHSSVSTVSPVSGMHRYSTAHYDLLVHGPAKRWILLPPGQWLLVNRTLALPETFVWFQQHLREETQMVKDLEQVCRRQEQRQQSSRRTQQPRPSAGGESTDADADATPAAEMTASWMPWCRALRTTAEVLTTLLPRTAQVMPPLELWDHHQLRWLLVPWLRHHCVGIFDTQVTQRVGDVVVVPHDYFYFYYHDPVDYLPVMTSASTQAQAQAQAMAKAQAPRSPSDTKRSNIPPSSRSRPKATAVDAIGDVDPPVDDGEPTVSAAAAVTTTMWHTRLLTHPPSVSVTQSFCTWFDTDTHTQGLGFILYGHRHPSSSHRTPHAAINDTASGPWTWLLDDSWRGRIGEAPRRSAQMHRDTPEHRYPVRPHNVPIFDFPM